MNKKLVIFIGPPGSGKGTIANLLEDNLGFKHMESSKLIEEKFEKTKPGDPEWEEVEKERELFNAGVLTTSSFVFGLIKGKVQEMSALGKSIVLSGSPRTLEEARYELPIFIEEYGKENVHVILMDVSPEVSISRNSRRRICEKKRHPIPWTPETENITVCPEDGSRLIDRGTLDDPETIKIRLETYAKETEPILGYIEEEFGITPVIVDGEQEVDVRFEETKKAIGL